MIGKHESKLLSSEYCYIPLTIQLNISHSFAHSKMMEQFHFVLMLNLVTYAKLNAI